MNSSTRSLLVTLGATAVIAAAYGAALRAGLPTFVLVILALVAMGAILAACAYWWKSADEAVREAHKFSWFWGSCFGLALLLPGLIVMSQAPELVDRIRPAGYPQVAFGVLLTLLLQLTGYLATWAVWWVRRR